ncbi:MAG: hypothetical protein R3D67_01585 [Hyphomicrobiaceae bacterium]
MPSISPTRNDTIQTGNMPRSNASARNGPIGDKRPVRPYSDYDRHRDLPRLLPLWPAEIADTTPEGSRHIIQRLKRALREERRRGIAGDWTYDLRRHAGLSNALKAEMNAMDLPLTSWAAPAFTRHAPAKRS